MCMCQNIHLFQSSNSRGFLEREVAQYALKEAIKLAQEAGDNVCLQLAHSWMSYLISKENK